MLEPSLRSDVTSDIFVIDSEHLSRQREWSERTFGPGTREGGVIDHIRKELVEIEEAEWPEKLAEWVDVVILALDGAWRCGVEPQVILDAIRDKQARNEARVWPDWRAMSADKAIEHDRSRDVARQDPVPAMHEKAERVTRLNESIHGHEENTMSAGSADSSQNERRATSARSEGGEGLTCGRLLVGRGDDTYDPECSKPRGHGGRCEP